MPPPTAYEVSWINESSRAFGRSRISRGAQSAAVAREICSRVFIHTPRARTRTEGNPGAPAVRATSTRRGGEDTHRERSQDL